MHKVKRAIIMAAGKGERLRPLTNTIPKPLIPVLGTPMIESIIQALNKEGIEEIYVVTGYLKDKFSYLPEKYPGLVLIENPDADKANNISSLYAAREHLEDVVILDGDQLVENPDVLHTDFERSGYACVWSDTPTREWVLELNENGIVNKCHRNGYDHGWQLNSISRWSKEDGQKLKKALEEEYIDKKNTQLFWDDVALFCQPGLIELGIEPISKDSICEIDSLEELRQKDPFYSSLVDENKVY